MKDKFDSLMKKPVGRLMLLFFIIAIGLFHQLYLQYGNWVSFMHHAIEKGKGEEFFFRLVCGNLASLLIMIILFFIVMLLTLLIDWILNGNDNSDDYNGY